MNRVMNLVKRYLRGKKVNPKDLKYLWVYTMDTPIMENQMEKKMEHEMETAIYIGLYKGYMSNSLNPLMWLYIGIV